MRELNVCQGLREETSKEFRIFFRSTGGSYVARSADRV
jgi:hypothetical protein